MRIKFLKVFLVLVLTAMVSFAGAVILTQTVQAQITQVPENLNNVGDLGGAETVTESSPSAAATASAGRQMIQGKSDQDLTVPTSKVADTLTEILEAHPVEMKGWNVLQVAIHRAVATGLPANMVVLLLLFPMIATMVVFARYVVGINSFGIYVPAVLSVAFVSMGLWPGIATFVIIILGVWFIRWLMRHLSLPSLSKTALTLWGISFIVLLFLLGATYFNIPNFLSLSIFPILILILLSEDFMNSQFFTNTRTAFHQVIMTVMLAMACALVVRLPVVQSVVIINPELTLVVTLAINILIGRYTGLRLTEIIRFRSVLKEK